MYTLTRAPECLPDFSGHQSARSRGPVRRSFHVGHGPEDRHDLRQPVEIQQNHTGDQDDVGAALGTCTPQVRPRRRPAP